MNCDGCPYILSFLWNLYRTEHTNVINMLRKKLIIGYFWYDDILINNKNTKPILTTYWKISITYISWKLKFVMGEQEDTLHFLDIISSKKKDTSKHVYTRNQQQIALFIRTYVTKWNTSELQIGVYPNRRDTPPSIQQKTIYF